MSTLLVDKKFWDLVQKILAKALELAIAERASFLAWVYGGL